MKRSILATLPFSLFFACSTQVSVQIPETYEDFETYLDVRNRLINAERLMRFDAGIVLNESETKANHKLMALKTREKERTLNHFPPAHSFLLSKTRNLIDESPVLDVMKRLPKGAVLHVHTPALLGDFEWLVSYATYLPDCYIYRGTGRNLTQGTLQLSERLPGNGWYRVEDLREAAEDVQQFDEKILRSLTLGEEDLACPDIWEEFGPCFQRAFPLIMHPSIYPVYLRRTLKALVEENVQYIESRNGSWDLDSKVVSEIQKDHPEFEIRYIDMALRSWNSSQMAEALQSTIEGRVKNPDRLLGFDLAGEEAATHSNLFFVDEILKARKNARLKGTSLPLFLHSGENNWTEDENLYDAVLLGVDRIGHGLALINHPLLMQIVKEKNIAIEVCPISNQVLDFVRDLRTHPAVHFLNRGLPVVLSPDDPAVMKYTFSYDFYMAFMAWGLDLKGLKQLALNSLTYSAMDEQEKARAIQSWEAKWDRFIVWLDQYDVAER
jgi:adenosine deaminase CECR1